MQTVVYFSHSGIQILQGTYKSDTVKIEKFRNIPIEQGALINGIITNEESLKYSLESGMIEEGIPFKSATLIIDSSLIITKNIEVPKLKERELKTLAKSEFEDTAGNYEELVIDYTKVPGKNGEDLFACAVEKRVLEPYISLFKSLKIKINRIDIGLNTIIRYVTKTPDYHGMTFALNLIDGNNLLSLLFENGIYTFSTRSRLMAERGTTAFANELSSKLSSLIQFNKSQKSEYALEMSLYAGLDEGELESVKNQVFDQDLKLFLVPMTPNVKASFNIDDTLTFENYLLPVSGFFMGKSPVNLLKAYEEKNANKKDHVIPYKLILPPVGIAVVILGITVFFFVINRGMNKDLKELNAYINNPQTQTEYANAQAQTAELTKLTNEVGNLESIDQAINSQPNIVGAKLTQMKNLCNDQISLYTIEYDGKTGDIMMSAMAKTELDAAKYVGRLKDTGFFAQVVYTGYTGAELITTATATVTAIMNNKNTTSTTTTTTTDTVYNFVVECYLKAGGQE